jgi:presenilin-like A22 family membrane protease
MDNKAEKTVFQASPALLAPVIASLFVGAFCAFLFLISDTSLPSVTLLPEVGFGPLVNAAVFVVAAAVGASVIYLMMKHKVRWLVRFLTSFAMAVVTFFLSELYCWMLFSLLNVGNVDLLAFMNAVLITVIVDIELFVLDNRGYEIIILMLGGALGAFLGASIPTFSAVLILLFLAVYDVVAVFRGPVGKIALEGLEHLRGLSFSFRDIQMGLGDLTFYSMLISHAIIFFGPLAAASGAVGVLAGSFFSFKMLEKKGMFPGLPFSIILGLAGVFTASLL